MVLCRAVTIFGSRDGLRTLGRIIWGHYAGSCWTERLHRLNLFDFFSDTTEALKTISERCACGLCKQYLTIVRLIAAALPITAPGFVRFGLPKGNHHAPSQEAPELGLLWGPADLGDHRSRNQWKNAKFQTGFVFSPCSPLVSIGGHENGGVADNRTHALRRTVRGVRSCARALRRASFISSVVRRPYCFSHRATAANEVSYYGRIPRYLSL